MLGKRKRKIPKVVKKAPVKVSTEEKADKDKK